MAMYGLSTADGNAVGVLAENLFDRRGFDRIISLSSRAVRVDIVDRCRRTGGRLQCRAHRGGLSGNGGACDVGCIRNNPVADQFTMNDCAALDCALPVLQYYDRRALTEHHATAAF